MAIKVIKNRKSFYAQAKIEIRILEFLNGKNCDGDKGVVRMLEYFTHHNHLCIVYEKLSHNLYEVLRRIGFEGLSLYLVRKFGLQILNTLKLLSRSDVQVIHCDLKPENILLKDPSKTTIKVIDFGSSCFHNEKTYSYIQSRFYRSPEVILGASYTTAIDMWSLGCVLVELFTGEPLFPGTTEHDQMCRIVELCGVPNDGMLAKGKQTKVNAMFVWKGRRGGHGDGEGDVEVVPVKTFRPSGRTLEEVIAKHHERFNCTIIGGVSDKGKVESGSMEINAPTTTTTLLPQQQSQTMPLQQPKLPSPQKTCQSSHLLPPSHQHQHHPPYQHSHHHHPHHHQAFAHLGDTPDVHGCLPRDMASFLDVIRGMLILDPVLRLTPEQALAHPFFALRGSGVRRGGGGGGGGGYGYSGGGGDGGGGADGGGGGAAIAMAAAVATTAGGMIGSV